MTVEQASDRSEHQDDTGGIAAGRRRIRGVATGTVLLACGLVLMVGCGAVLALASLAPTDPVLSDAAPEPAPVTAPASDPTALDLIRRAATQSTSVSYKGVQILTELGDSPSISYVEISHANGESIATAVDGTVPTTLADIAMPTASQGESQTPVPQVLPLLEANYQLTVGTADSVAGTPASVVEARRPTGVLAARYWIEPTSGVVLQRQLFAADGTLTAESAFTAFQLLASDAAGGAVPTPAQTLGAAAIGESDVASLRQAQWEVPTSLGPGLVLLDVRWADTAQGVLHLTYTDGLVSLSLFEQKGSLDVPALNAQEGWDVAQVDGRRVVQALGVPRRVAWSDGQRVYTVVSDSGGSTIPTAMDALPRSPGTGTMRDRVRRGMDRVGSWLTP